MGRENNTTISSSLSRCSRRDKLRGTSHGTSKKGKRARSGIGTSVDSQFRESRSTQPRCHYHEALRQEARMFRGNFSLHFVPRASYGRRGEARRHNRDTVDTEWTIEDRQAPTLYRLRAKSLSIHVLRFRSKIAVSPVGILYLNYYSLSALWTSPMKQALLLKVRCLDCIACPAL